MKQKELEIILSQIESFKKPKIKLEQYQTPGRIAAMITWRAKQLGDIENKKVADYCCGTGIFAIAAALLGAKEVYGYDIDPEAIKIAKKNERGIGVKINWLIKDVKEIEEIFDTVIMNSPFGVKSEIKDREFLKKALVTSRVSYTIHLYTEKNIEFLKRYIEKREKRVAEIIIAEFEIPHIYRFHKKRYHVVKVAIIRATEKR